MQPGFALASNLEISCEPLGANHVHGSMLRLGTMWNLGLESMCVRSDVGVWGSEELCIFVGIGEMAGIFVQVVLDTLTARYHLLP